MPAQPPWDPGLQPERTGLAWLRTSLSIMVGTAALAKLSAHASGTLALVVLTCGLPLSALVTWLAWRRYLTGQRRLHAGNPLPGASLPALASLVVVVLACAGITYVLATA